ncbi:hypothetical protein [Marinobacter sp. OP 3.4]|uniref:hypothetical protein n=1 Tax=Marinobacter sp. OP 3.4 TaxID=3076501 RepID=UPI002E21B3FB
MRIIPRLVQSTTDTLIPRLRRLDPYYRDHFDRLARGPLQAFTQGLIRLRQRPTGLGLTEERPMEDEAALIDDITDLMNRFLEREYGDTGETAERAGNTKTYGLVRGVFRVNDYLAPHLRTPLFQPGERYLAYARFGGPGPRVVPDIEDNGILSIGLKLMGVPGPKLLDDERHTVDFSGISAPTFTTPDLQENVKLQQQVGLGTPAWYFLNPFDSHYLDMVMQGLYARAHANPLHLAYHSCVPYLYDNGDGRPRAIKYALLPRRQTHTRAGPFTPNYLRDAMRETLAQEPVSFDFAIQFQTDPRAMPIENAAIVWSTRDSPLVRVARLDLHMQRFDYPAQDAFARNLTINPWHTIAEHRPLGNQNRARRAIYYATSRTRQAINGEQHIEPTGHERFDLAGEPDSDNAPESSEETAHEPV